MSNANELKHHGIIGQKWGVRRYQNKDGSLTPAGKRREARINAQMSKTARKYNDLKNKKLVKEDNTKQVKQQKPKTVKDMSDTELREKASRLELENRYTSAVTINNRLNPKQVSKGQAFVNSVKNDVIKPALKESGKKILTDYLTTVGKEVINTTTNKNKK